MKSGALVCVLVAGAVSACWVDRKSPDFKCETSADCGDGRSCSPSGYCTITDAAPPIDAYTCGAACTNAGGRCAGSGNRTCTFDCATGECMSAIVCPPGLPCTINCMAAGTCSGPITCNGATPCKINCTGAGSCGGAINCGSGKCDVTCGGTGACTGGVGCSASCACDVNCSGTNSCTPDAVCPPGNPCDDGAGCTSMPGACKSC